MRSICVPLLLSQTHTSYSTSDFTDSLTDEVESLPDKSIVPHVRAIYGPRRVPLILAFEASVGSISSAMRNYATFNYNPLSLRVSLNALLGCLYAASDSESEALFGRLTLAEQEVKKVYTVTDVVNVDVARIMDAVIRHRECVVMCAIVELSSAVAYTSEVSKQLHQISASYKRVLPNARNLKILSQITLDLINAAHGHADFLTHMHIVSGASSRYMDFKSTIGETACVASGFDINFLVHEKRQVRSSVDEITLLTKAYATSVPSHIGLRAQDSSDIIDASVQDVYAQVALVTGCSTHTTLASATQAVCRGLAQISHDEVFEAFYEALRVICAHRHELEIDFDFFADKLLAVTRSAIFSRKLHMEIAHFQGMI